MNRHERRKAIRERVKRGGNVGELNIKPSDYDKIGSGTDEMELVMACVRAFGGGVYAPDMPEREVFRGFAELIQKKFIRVHLNMEDDHVGAQMDFLDPETGKLMFSGDYERVIELHTSH